MGQDTVTYQQLSFAAKHTTTMLCYQDRDMAMAIKQMGTQSLHSGGIHTFKLAGYDKVQI